MAPNNQYNLDGSPRGYISLDSIVDNFAYVCSKSRIINSVILGKHVIIDSTIDSCSMSKEKNFIINFCEIKKLLIENSIIYDSYLNGRNHSYTHIFQSVILKCWGKNIDDLIDIRYSLLYNGSIRSLDTSIFRRMKIGSGRYSGFEKDNHYYVHEK